MREAVSDLFAVHWPFKQPTRGARPAHLAAA